MLKKPPASAGGPGDVNSRVRKIPCRRKWQLTPVFLPGEPHGQSSLESYSPWGHKEWDMMEYTSKIHYLGYFFISITSIPQYD